MRIPRKLKKKIPKDTHYCYKATSGIIYEEGDSSTPLGELKKLPYFKVKYCPFSTGIKIKDMNPMPTWVDQEYLYEFGEIEINWCRLVKCEIEDSCKSCGERYGRR